MAQVLNSFPLRYDYIKFIRPLSNSDAGQLFIHILEYVNGEDQIVINDTIRPLFEIIKNDIDCNAKTYNTKTGKYHWNYKGGITPINKQIRNSIKMNYWRGDVFSRDNYTCQKCNVLGGILNAHHIKEFSKYPELRFDIDNGITLCKDCHIQIHKKINL